MTQHINRTRLEDAQRKLMEAVVTAIPAINIDFTAYVVDNGKGGFEVRLTPITEKGEAYMPYLANFLKKELKGEDDEKTKMETK